ncbi:MAG TPA: hypothetical protein VGT41_04085 [Candidatus Babeliales bacterium]|nr:hypothetical protein [Candidatus Babeliales bacterium]
MKAYLKTTLLLCLWACLGISLNITAAQAAQEEIKEDAYVPKRTQLLTIFLDNYEAKSKNGFVLPKLLSALQYEAGPIITSKTLLSLVPTSGVNRQLSDLWITHTITDDLLIMVPQSYLKKKSLPIESLGLKMPAQSSASPDPTLIKNQYKSYAESDWQDLIKHTGTSFVNALLQGAIFDQTNKEVEWVIYLSGHGFYNQNIAGISLKDFSKVLDFFDKKISVALFVYVSCYAAGLNAAQVYKDQIKSGLEGEKEYSFPIATQAISDLEVVSKHSLYEQRFKGFINTFIENRFAYEEFLPLIMSERKKLMAMNRKAIGNFPQIRLAHSPIWLPITSLKKETVHITETMASTREQPLLIGDFVKTILLSSDYIPFEIDLAQKAFPEFIITMPADVIIYIEKMTLPWGKTSLKELSKLVRHDYEGAKKIYIKEVVIENEKALAITHADVFLDLNDPLIYYTTEKVKSAIPAKTEKARANFATYANSIALAQQLKELRLQQRNNFHSVKQNIAQKALATESIADLLSEKNKILLHAQEQLDAAYQNKNFPEKHRQIIQHYINTLEEGLDTSNPRIMQQQIMELRHLIGEELGFADEKKRQP